jgi:hypothetical protein
LFLASEDLSMKQAFCIKQQQSLYQDTPKDKHLYKNKECVCMCVRACVRTCVCFAINPDFFA